MEVHMTEVQPGVRRLCVAAATWPAGLLAVACETGDVGRLCLTVDAQDGTEMAFAPPGVHEAGVVAQLATVMEGLTGGQIRASPTIMAFHVGITRIEGDGFGGAAALRARGLLLDPDVRNAAAACPGLAIVMSEGLYSDLQDEGIPIREWMYLPSAGAWVRCYMSRRDQFQ
jgi:hypothetical protein